MAECRRLPLDCHQIAVRLPFRGWSLIAGSVETGGRVQGVTGVSRDRQTDRQTDGTVTFHLREVVPSHNITYLLLII